MVCFRYRFGRWPTRNKHTYVPALLRYPGMRSQHSRKLCVGRATLPAYHVYRRDLQEGAPAQRIASVNVETSFRDTEVKQEHTYAYSVSAIDQSGNESKPSPEVEETLPRR